MISASKEPSDDALLLGGFAVFLLGAVLSYCVPVEPYTTAAYWLGGIAAIFVVAYIFGPATVKMFVALPIRILLEVCSLAWISR
jgi:hypothetical protein